MEENKIKQYNAKGFLASDSIKSMAAYHAKIMPGGEYLFRIHDCIGGIRLRGDLNELSDVMEAVEKLNALEQAVGLFRDFIPENYLSKQEPHESPS